MTPTNGATMISTSKTRPIILIARLAAILLGGLLALAPPGAYGQEARDPGAKVKLPGRIFLSSFDKDDPLRGITMIDPNDGTWQGITDERTAMARISPDGRLVALNPFGAGGADPGLRVYRTSGGGMPVKVSERRGNPCWSPDGKTLLIATPAPGNVRETEFWRVAADGSREERLPIPATERVLDWSPDGRWLVSFSLRETPDRPVYLMHPDGTGERLLLASADPVPEYGGSLGIRAHFSPDGRKALFDHIVFAEGVRPPKHESSSLIELDVESGRLRRFFERKGADFSFSSCWSPDGKAIAVLVVEGDLISPLRPSKTHVEIVDTDGRVFGTVPVPGAGISRNLIDWR
jgi:Tol biopolymer transport system component